MIILVIVTLLPITLSVLLITLVCSCIIKLIIISTQYVSLRGLAKLLMFVWHVFFVAVCSVFFTNKHNTHNHHNKHDKHNTHNKHNTHDTHNTHNINNTNINNRHDGQSARGLSSRLRGRELCVYIYIYI